jgi:hypothetical protein
MLWKLGFGYIIGAGYVSGLLMFLTGRKVVALAWSFGDDSHELCAHAARFSFGADVTQWDRGTAEQADCSRAADRAFAGDAAWSAELEADSLALWDWDDIAVLALLTEPEGAYKGHDATARWVGAGDCAGPDPRYDLGLDSGDLDLRVQVADSLFGLVAHPLAVAANVFC